MAQWSEEKKMIALAAAEMSTIREASEQTGVPEGTIKRWRSEMRAAGKRVRIARRLEPLKPNPPAEEREPEATEPAPVGRPSKYQDDFAAQAFKLCLLGATDKDLAGFFDTTEQTINAWKKAHPEFLEALKAGKNRADAEVANRLYRRALGYSHKEDKIFQYEGEPVIVPTTKHYPPDTTAMIFWLKNRQPGSWRDKRDVEVAGQVDVNNPFAGLSTEELRQIVDGQQDTSKPIN